MICTPWNFLTRSLNRFIIPTETQWPWLGLRDLLRLCVHSELIFLDPISGANGGQGIWSFGKTGPGLPLHHARTPENLQVLYNTCRDRRERNEWENFVVPLDRFPSAPQCTVWEILVPSLCFSYLKKNKPKELCILTGSIFLGKETSHF